MLALSPFLFHLLVNFLESEEQLRPRGQQVGVLLLNVHILAKHEDTLESCFDHRSAWRGTFNAMKTFNRICEACILYVHSMLICTVAPYP